MKYSKLLSGFIASTYIAVSLVALLPAPSANALYGAALPTKCGTVKGYTTITATDPFGKIIKTVDSAAKYYSNQAPGAKNECVKDIQRMLNASYCTTGTKLTVDGSYGSKTTTAVKKMQSYLSGYNFRINGAKIIVDGKVGPQTWSLLSTSNIDARFNPCQ
jgi:peptidoglycan hydrolase-like protein with peptidoglycan-binding domain